MRALVCECGQHLETAGDQDLFERAREHVDGDHPDMDLSEEQVRGIVEQSAYDLNRSGGRSPRDPSLRDCKDHGLRKI